MLNRVLLTVILVGALCGFVSAGPVLTPVIATVNGSSTWAEIKPGDVIMLNLVNSSTVVTGYTAPNSLPYIWDLVLVKTAGTVEGNVNAVGGVDYTALDDTPANWTNPGTGGVGWNTVTTGYWVGQKQMWGAGYTGVPAPQGTDFQGIKFIAEELGSVVIEVRNASGTGTRGGSKQIGFTTVQQPANNTLFGSLEITVTPEPMTVALMGLRGLAMLRRRRA